jgi:hypothetical protein
MELRQRVERGRRQRSEAHQVGFVLLGEVALGPSDAWMKP